MIYDKELKYCYTCRAKLTQERFVHHYKTKTGKPVYRLNISCPTNEKRGKKTLWEHVFGKRHFCGRTDFYSAC